VNKGRLLLRKYHIWLGWVIALPFLFWAVSGLIMVMKPIEEVRGTHLLGEAPKLPSGLAVVPPQIGPRPVESILLEQRGDGPKWIVRYADGNARLADTATGRLLPPLSAPQAVSVLKARYAGEAEVIAVDRTAADNPPLDLRRPMETWRISMSDGTRFYVSTATGEIVARRTAFWRFYDLMWGLHIMDLQTRENTNNPLVIGFGIAAVIATILAILLLPMTIRRRRRA
jgi:hypothetical protein